MRFVLIFINIIICFSGCSQPLTIQKKSEPDCLQLGRSLQRDFIEIRMISCVDRVVSENCGAVLNENLLLRCVEAAGRYCQSVVNAEIDDRVRFLEDMGCH